MNNRSIHIILVFFFCAVSSQWVNAQSVEDTKVTIEVEKVTMSDFLNKLSEIAKLSISFSGTTTDKYSITLSVKDQTLKETLTLAFKSTPLQYTVMTRGIMVFEPEKKSQSESLELIGISGTVRDKGGNAIPGVSVFVKGTTNGTSTDENGKYAVEVNGDDILVFSFIGYKTFETSTAARTMIDIVLEEDTKFLQEVTINGGYYETTDKLKTGSIVKVTSKDIENQPVTSPLMALQGRVAGLDITNNSGVPGSAPLIRIRGVNSLRGYIPGKRNLGPLTVGPQNDGNQVLYIIDGVPIDATPIQSAGNVGSDINFDPLSNINPENIASIEVLKDADATAIYGSRGANGVILISTKRNTKTTGKMAVDLKVYQGAGQISQKIDLLNTQQYVNMRKEAYRNDNVEMSSHRFAYDINKWDTTRYTDWQDVLLGGTASIMDVQGGVSSGTQNTRFSLSGAYHKETLVTPGDFGYVKGSGSLSVDHNSSDQKFKISIVVNYGVSSNSRYGGNFVDAALNLPPNAPALYNANGELNWSIYDLENNGYLTSTWENPMAITLRTSEAISKNLVINGNFGYQLLPGLVVSTSLGLTELHSKDKLGRPGIASAPLIDGRISPRLGSARFINGDRNSWTVEPKISWIKNWDKHGLNVIGGATWQQSKAWDSYADGRKYLSDALLGSLNGAGEVTQEEVSSMYKFVSQYGRIGYNYGDKYLVSLTARRDGSSRFGPENRFGLFWAVGGGWIFSEENVIKNNLSFISLGKIRASYGTTGSDGIGDYGYYDLYDVMDILYQGTRGLAPTSLFNPNYGWEETRKLEFAVELSFFQNRVSTEINWYRNRSTNQVTNYPLSSVTGFTSVTQNFEATVQNTGFETVVRGDIISSNNWRWSASVNLSLPRNELYKFDGIEDSPFANVYKVGEPLSILWLYTFKGVNPSTGLYEVEDKNNDGIYDDDDRSLMNALKKSYYGGINNTIQYKDFEFSFLLQFVSSSAPAYFSSGAPGVLSNQSTHVLDRWQNEGDVSDIQRYAIFTTGGAGGTEDGTLTHLRMRESNAAFTDASFVRLKTLSFGYRFSSSWLERIKIQHAKIFLQGQNLFTLTKYQGLDPETGINLPPLRIITLGLQLKL